MRYLFPFISKDLKKKMVFLGGPRQCGKTTLAEDLLHHAQSEGFHQGQYFNWDLQEDQQVLLKKAWNPQNDLLVFDELHKYPKWKNWIKGIYDTQKKNHRFLVTGSARLDVYKRGGDSLFGRYHYWRLHPFTLSELPPKMPAEEAFKRLMTVGGFPEPFLDGNETEARRWRKERFDKVLREDVRDLEPLREIRLLALLLDLLCKRVGNLVVVSNLAEDLQVSPKTVSHWLEVLERMYLIFMVRPYGNNLPRAIQKPPKVYFFDNADVLGDEGARFENLVATHLLKKIQFLEDSTGFRYELRYLRDKEGREVDFVILKEGNVEELIEAKWSDPDPARSLSYYSEKLRPKQAIQIVGVLKRPLFLGKLKIQSATEILTESAWSQG